MMRIVSVFLSVFLVLLGVACGPKVDVSIVKTDVYEPVETEPKVGEMEKLLPATPPRPFVLGGGPATFEGEELTQYLVDKQRTDTDPSGWSEKVEALVTAEYIDPIEKPISLEVYRLTDPMLAKLFADAYFTDGEDRAHAVVDRYVVSVLWFVTDDVDMADAGEDILNAVKAAIEKDYPPPWPSPAGGGESWLVSQRSRTSK